MNLRERLPVVGSFVSLTVRLAPRATQYMSSLCPAKVIIHPGSVRTPPVALVNENCVDICIVPEVCSGPNGLQWTRAQMWGFGLCSDVDRIYCLRVASQVGYDSQGEGTAQLSSRPYPSCVHYLGNGPCPEVPV